MNKIPKKIHLIWFGDKSKFKFDVSKLKSLLPNYTIKVWNESDFNWDELLKIPYVKKAYLLKSWAFLSDYLRLKILYEEGGIYLDSDMYVLKDFKNLFENKEFVLSFENTTTTSMGIVGSYSKNDFFKNLMFIYESFIDGKMIMGNVIWDYVAKRDLNIKINGKHQEKDDFVIYDFKKFSLLKKRIRFWKRKDQYMLHKHTVTWVPKKYRKMMKLMLSITQKITILNKMYFFILIWPKKQMYKNYVFLNKDGVRKK